MPSWCRWSAKAQALIDYGTVGRRGRIAGTNAAVELLVRPPRGARSAIHGPCDDAIQKCSSIRRLVAIRPAITGIEDLHIAPFHLLASEGSIHVDKPDWHMALIAELAAVLPIC
jgi:protein phosphatase